APKPQAVCGDRALRRGDGDFTELHRAPAAWDFLLIPAKAGIHFSSDNAAARWVPAFAGTQVGAVTELKRSLMRPRPYRRGAISRSSGRGSILRSRPATPRRSTSRSARGCAPVRLW